MTGPRNILPALISILCLSACAGGGGKKVLVMSSGKISVNGNTINHDPGTTHNEATIDPDGDSVFVITGNEKKGYAIKDAGLYILNIKNDTIVGSYLPTGTDPRPRQIDEEEVTKREDSLRQLMAGTNVSAQAKNYNLPPSTIRFISKNIDAQIIGPYLKVPGSFDPSKQHEIYKFYTNKEIVEILDKLDKMHSKIRVVPPSASEEKTKRPG